jgi:hypothetical protein
MSNEIKTQGTEIWVLDTTQSPGVLLKLANITNFGDFGPQSDDIDSTNFDSTAKEKLSGLPDNGDATLQLNVADLESHRWLWDNNGNSERFYFCVGYADATTDPTAPGGSAIVAPTARTADIFYASVKSFRQTVGMNDILRATAALSISGAITRTWKSGL